MRIPKTWAPLIAKRIINDLIKKELIASKVPVEELVVAAEHLIMDELIVEDKLNDEVREILRKHSAEIEKGKLDYRKVFELTKKKIIEERGIVI